MNRLKRCLCALSVLCAAVAGGSSASSQTAVVPDHYGLWRDFDGGLWCGGTCGPGQQCCTITPTP